MHRQRPRRDDADGNRDDADGRADGGMASGDRMAAAFDDELDDETVEFVVPRLSWSRDDLVAWVRWVGVGRVVLAGGIAAVGLAAAWWLLRPPDLPTEAVLPRAAAAAPATTDLVTSEAAVVAPPGTPGSAAGPVSTVPTRVLVHVAGAVVRPGVVVLDAESRVVDAIDAAGGARTDGAVDMLNLAALVTDGDRIEVPVFGEERAPAVLHQRSVAAGSESPPGPVDINDADVALLETLPGIGPATAAAIVQHRETHGPFVSIDELTAVSGIGPAKLARLGELVTV